MRTRTAASVLVGSAALLWATACISHPAQVTTAENPEEPASYVNGDSEEATPKSYGFFRVAGVKTVETEFSPIPQGSIADYSFIASSELSDVERTVYRAIASELEHRQLARSDAPTNPLELGYYLLEPSVILLAYPQVEGPKYLCVQYEWRLPGDSFTLVDAVCTPLGESGMTNELAAQHARHVVATYDAHVGALVARRDGMVLLAIAWPDSEPIFDRIMSLIDTLFPGYKLRSASEEKTNSHVAVWIPVRAADYDQAKKDIANVLSEKGLKVRSTSHGQQEGSPRIWVFSVVQD